MERTEFAKWLRECRKSIDYVNPSDKHFWPNTYIIWLDTGCYVSAGFLIHGSSDLSACHDAIADYCKDKGYKGYFADPEYIEELRRDALEQGFEEDDFVEEKYSSAGNEGDYFANILVVDELTERTKK